jgi:hypothetical protein
MNSGWNAGAVDGLSGAGYVHADHKPYQLLLKSEWYRSSILLAPVYAFYLW